MPQQPERVDVEMIAFMVDDRPHVFINDIEANRRFLNAIDSDYWAYQSRAHARGLEVENKEDQQRSAIALRLAYSQGLETLFALIVALIQCPQFPIG